MNVEITYRDSLPVRFLMESLPSELPESVDKAKRELSKIATESKSKPSPIEVRKFCSAESRSHEGIKDSPADMAFGWRLLSVGFWWHCRESCFPRFSEELSPTKEVHVLPNPV